MEWRISESKNEVAKQFARFFYELTKDKEVFHVALSGGSTPKVVFDLLAADYAETINWSSIHFYWGDERCVAPTDDQSNYKMTVTHLFSKISIPETNINRIVGEDDPSDEAKRYSELLEDKLDDINGIPQFDLVILGMGDDGHTASIFPHEIDLWDADENCVVATHPASGQKRVSLTGKVINAAKQIAFLVTGANKAEKFGKIRASGENARIFPAALVKPTAGELTWFLDEAAVGTSFGYGLC